VRLIGGRYPGLSLSAWTVRIVLWVLSAGVLYASALCSLSGRSISGVEL